MIRPFTLDWFVREEIFRHEVRGMSVRMGDMVLDGLVEIGLFLLQCQAMGARETEAFGANPENLPLRLINASFASIHPKALWINRGSVKFCVAQNKDKSNGPPFHYGEYTKVSEIPSEGVNEYLPWDALKTRCGGFGV